VTEPANVDTAHSIAFEAFGVRIGVTADPAELLDRVAPLLPPGSRACSPTAVEVAFGIVADEDGSYRLTREDSPVVVGVDLDFALMLLDGQIRISVGLHTPNRIFVHAGVVAHEGWALVLPGLSFAGKTTLVVALIGAGATYYSDEFAVLDEHGLVHPYAKSLSIRDRERAQSDHKVESLGGIAGAEALRIGAVVFTKYRAGAEWKPTRLSPARAALAMLENTLPVLTRSEEAIRAIKRAIDGAVLLEGDRGEAGAVAPELLDCVSG
jgi:hypothetical protein